jgi:HEAT repeat protein
LLFAVLIGLLAGWGLYFLCSREPQYQGKSLSDWFDDLHESSGWSRDRAEDVIRQIGPASIPFLIRYLKYHPSTNSLKSKLSDWLADHPRIPIHLDPEVDHSEQAVAAFKALGPIGKPAIGELVAMLPINDHNSYQAAQCLAAIGPASIPALTNALVSSTNIIVRANAMVALGQMGTNAIATAPLLASLIHDTNRFIARDAIRALGEMGEAGERYAPTFEKMLWDTNYCEAAAFALARFWPEHVDALLDALTNSNTGVFASAAAGLQPQWSAGGPTHPQHSSGYSFGGAMNRFEFDEKHIALKSAARKIIVQNTLLVDFDNPHPSIRARIARMLGESGAPGYRSAAGLSKALNDEDKGVRKAAAEALAQIGIEVSEGGIIRGPKTEKKIALEFTGHTFAEGGETILNELAKRRAKASFFLTGDFLDNPDFKPLVSRMVKEGHYVGPHSDKHLLYCPWDGPKKTLVTKAAFQRDLGENFQKLRRSSVFGPISYWLPAYEWYNQDIVDWSRDTGLTLVNFTPGTRSNSDYTEESATNFVSSREILESIYKKEREDPHGLNGFLLLMHLGAGPGRKDKLADHLGELLDQLSAKGYQFVRVDELLNPK